MKKKTVKKVLLVSLLVSSVSALEHTVSLDEAIAMALENNSKLKVSQTAIDISKTMYNQAMSAHYPTLDVSISAMRLDELTTFDMRGTTTLLDGSALSGAMVEDQLTALATSSANTHTNLINTSIAIQTGTLPTQTMEIVMDDVKMTGRDTVLSQVNATLPLYTGGKITAIVEQANIGKKIAHEAARRTQNEIIFDVKRYYYGVLLTKQLRKLSDDTIGRMGFIRDLTSTLYQGGSMNVKKTDYLRTKLSVNLIETLHEDIVQSELMAKSALLFAMGLPWTDSVDITQESIQEPKMDKTLESLVNNAYNFNPDYTSLKLAINVYDAKIDEAKSDYLPSVGLMASAQNIYNDYEYGLVNDANKNSWTIGVGVQWSLFNGMRTTNQVQQSRLEKLKLQQQEVLLEEGLALQVKQAFLQMQSTHKKYTILNEAVLTAEQSRDLNTRAYQEDMVETKDVIESQLFESYTKAAHYKSAHDHALARIQADFVVGTALEESLNK